MKAIFFQIVENEWITFSIFIAPYTFLFLTFIFSVLGFFFGNILWIMAVVCLILTYLSRYLIDKIYPEIK